MIKEDSIIFDMSEIKKISEHAQKPLVFDTTNKKLAEDNGFYNENMEYGPIVVCIGEQHILAGLERALEGKELGKYKIELKPEDAFGKKDAKLIQLISTSKFRKQNIQPIPGLQVNIDGVMGIVKTVSGGRTLVDFNHPLAGKDLVYEVDVKRIVEDDKEKVKSYIKLALNLKDANVKIENNEASVELKKEIPKEAEKQLAKKIQELIPALKKVAFIIQKEQKK